MKRRTTDEFDDLERQYAEMIEAWDAGRTEGLAKLPPFVGNVHCSKCDWPGVGIDWKPEVKPNFPSSMRFTWPEYEHILRTCTRCGFTWKQRPVDAEVAA